MIVAVVIAFALGLLAGGRIENLGRIQLRYGAFLFGAILLRYGTEAAIRYGISPVADFRLPIYALTFASVGAILYANRGQPGLIVASAGVVANGLAIVLNGGWMPVWPPALQLVGMTSADLAVSFHRLLPAELGGEFLVRGGPFGDLIPIPIPILTNVMSIGDAFIAAGLAWYVFATLVAPEQETAAAEDEALGAEIAPSGAELAGGLPPVPAGSGFASMTRATDAGFGRSGMPPGADRTSLSWPGVRPGDLRERQWGELQARSAAAVLSRPVLLGGPTSGVAFQPDVLPRPLAPLEPGETHKPAGTPASPATPEPAIAMAAASAVSTAAAIVAPAVATPAPAFGASATGRVPALPLPARASRGVRARFATHPYVRLALDARFSALWIGQTISLLGDRLNQIALGVLVLSITGSTLDVGLTFLAATLPNLLFGPFAGAFVDRWDQRRVMVASDLARAGLVLLIPLAAEHTILLVYPIVFAVTTVSIFFRPARSAVIPRIVRAEDLTPANAAMYTAETIGDLAGYPLAGLFVAFLGSALTLAFWFDAASYLVSALLIASLTIPPVVRAAGPAVAGTLDRYLGEIGTAWRFLRADAPLLQNTIISGIAQLAAGATVALSVVYARDVLDGTVIPYPQSYAAIDLLIGVGSLAGGIAIGAVGSRWRKGRLVVAGYIGLGVATMLLGMTRNEVVALALAAGAGVANMVFLIPTQTLFAERTPQELMGRVVGIRFSMVLGPLTLAMAASGLLAQFVGVPAVFVSFGLVTALAGLVGLLLPAVRDI